MVVANPRSRVVPNDPLRADPTRTKILRDRFEREFRTRFAILKRKILQLVAEEDSFGLKQRRTFTDDSSIFRRGNIGNFAGFESNVIEQPTKLTANEPFQFLSDSSKLEEFQRWIKGNTNAIILANVDRASQDAYWTAFVQEGYAKGAGRAFDDVKKPALASNPGEFAFFQGSKQQFLEQSFAAPIGIEKVKVLSARVFTGLEGITTTMSGQMTRVLTEGLARGESPFTVAREMNKSIDKIGKTRATMLARTEIIRAHAEGQLDAMEAMGVTHVGVQVEWKTARDGKVCQRCQPMEKVVLKVKEARGLIPLHPNCRCAFAPANLGESTKGQKKSKVQIDASIKKSIKASIPKSSKRTIAQQKALTPFRGTTISKKRPKGILDGPTKSSLAKAGKRIRKVSKPVDTLAVFPDFIKKFGTKEERSTLLRMAKRRTVIKKRMKTGLATPEEIAEFDASMLERDRIRAEIKKRMGGAPPTPTPTPTPKPKIKKPKKKEPKPQIITPEEDLVPGIGRLTDAERKKLADLARQRNFLSKSGRETLESLEARAKFDLDDIGFNPHDAIEDKLSKSIELNKLVDDLTNIELKFKAEEESLRESLRAINVKQTANNKEKSKAFSTHMEKRKQLEQTDSFAHPMQFSETAESKSFMAIDSELTDEVEKIKSKLSRIRIDNKKAGSKLLELPEERRVKITGTPAGRSVPTDYGPTLENVTGPFKHKMKKAEEYLTKMTGKGGIGNRPDYMEVNAHQFSRTGRAFHRAKAWKDDGIYLDSQDSVSIFIHEIVHEMEEATFSRGSRVSNEFIDYRIRKSGKPTRKMDDVFPDRGYGDSELGNEDSFTKAFLGEGSDSKWYAGKTYSSGNTEVLTMGVQLLFKNPIKFAKADPEYFKFVVGSLRGLL